MTIRKSDVSPVITMFGYSASLFLIGVLLSKFNISVKSIDHLLIGLTFLRSLSEQEASEKQDTADESQRDRDLAGDLSRPLEAHPLVGVGP